MIFLLSGEKELMSLCVVDLIFPTGAEIDLAEPDKGKPLESDGRGGETLQRSLQAVCHGQAGPRETRTKR